MGSSSKSGSSQQSLNYYGTIAGAFCWGPLQWLTALVCNGNYVWQCSPSGPLDLTASGALAAGGYVDLTGGILDPTLIASGGYLRLYAGFPNQGADAALTGDAYQDTVVLVGKNIFFGEDSGTAPNFQLIGGRCPLVDTSIVAAEDNIVVDRQINPIASLAEFLLDERGKGMLLSQLDPTSWQAAGHWCAQDAAHQAFTFISPLITEQSALRDVRQALLDPISGYTRWLPNGKLGCFIYEWGTNPGGLVTVDARHFTKELKGDLADWVSVPTGIVASFTDRAYEFQTNTVLVPNERATQIRGVADPSQIDRQHVTKQPQAQSQAMEYMRRLSMGPGTATGVLRGSLIPGVVPGSKILINVDPQTGGAGLAQLARVDGMKIDRSDDVELDITYDPLLPAVAYTPDWTSPLPETTFHASSAPTLAYRLAIPLPPGTFDWPPAVGFLTTRPSMTVTGFSVYFSQTSGGAFAELGSQLGFAVRASLITAVGTGDTTMELQMLDGANGPDAYLAANTPGGNTTAAENNTLLAILVQLDGSGRVALDGSGNPIMEMASIVQRSAVTTDTHNYTVLRGRCGLAARAWGAATAAWIVPIANLTPWRHLLFASLEGAPAYFRLQAFTDAAVDETIPLPEADVIFPTLAPPTALTAITPGGQLVTLAWADSVNLDDGLDEYIIYRATAGAGGPFTEIGRTRSTSFHDTGQTGGLTIGTQYWYAVTALDLSDDESVQSNVVTATPNGVAANTTPPQNAGAASEADGGHTTVASDGSVSASLDVLVPALPVAGGGILAAAWQNLLFRRTGVSSQWQIGAGNLTNTGAVTVSVDLLSPGVGYDIALQAFTSFGIPSAIVVATGSPFTAPNKGTSAPAPGSISSRVPTTGDAVPPAYQGAELLPATIIEFTGVTSDRSLIGYEYYLGELSGPPTTGQAINPVNVIPASPDGGTVQIPVYGQPSLLSLAGWVRSIDSTGNTSTWTGSGGALAWTFGYAGNMGAQDSNAVEVSGVQTGAAGASSVRQVLASCPVDMVYVTTGGHPTETFNVDISNRGFTTAPDNCQITPTSQTLGNSWYYNAGASSSTTAVIVMQGFNGANIGAAQDFGLSFIFTEYD